MTVSVERGQARRSATASGDAHRRIGAWLRTALRGEVNDDPGPVVDTAAACDPRQAAAAAVRHGVAGWIAERIGPAATVDPFLAAALRERQQQDAAANLRGTFQLARLAEVLDATGVDWIIVKGPAVTDLLYGGLGRRGYLDLDVLVDPAGFPAVVARLDDAGAQLLDRNWALIRAEHRGQLHFALPGGMPLDLHWDLINVDRAAMDLSTRDILDRSARVDLGGLSVPTADPADTMLHLAVHAAMSGGDRLVWLKDLERAAANRPPDWDDLLARAATARALGPLGLMLSRARQELRAPIELAVIEAALGRRRSRLIRRLDARSPISASDGRRSRARLMARTIGHGRSGGIAWLAGRSRRHLDPRHDAPSAFVAGGTTSDRDAFLRAVAEGIRLPPRT